MGCTARDWVGGRFWFGFKFTAVSRSIGIEGVQPVRFALVVSLRTKYVVAFIHVLFFVVVLSQMAPRQTLFADDTKFVLEYAPNALHTPLTSWLCAKTDTCYATLHFFGHTSCFNFYIQEMCSAKGGIYSENRHRSGEGCPDREICISFKNVTILIVYR